MKRSIALLVMTFFASCSAKNGPTLPQLQDGVCSLSQDRCTIGRPSNTGDTSSPYEWVCLGINGGANASCSRRITIRGTNDRFFAGENNLATRVNAAGPLKGKLVIADPTAHDEGEITHAKGMKSIVTTMGVPEESLVVTTRGDFFGKEDQWRKIWKETLVVGHPSAFAMYLSTRRVDSHIKGHDFLHVAAAGNTYQDEEMGSRNFWYPEHPHWQQNAGAFENAFEAFATGKLILATFAEVNYTQDTVTEHLDSVRCGMAKEYCYSVRRPYRLTGTSSATSALSALAFYLSQLWDSPQEVVHVLNICAEDIGEPGVDEAYGRGLVSVVCDTVRDREVQVVAQSMQVTSDTSPILNRMARNGAPGEVRGFAPFFSVDGWNTEVMTGHLGGELSTETVDLFLSAGSSYWPLGVQSSLLHNARTPFVEFGTKRTVLEGTHYQIALLGTYGYSGQEGMSARVGHVGTQYRHRLESGTILLQIGYRQVRGTVGIPGHREAGAEPAPFTDGNPEISISFTLQ